MTPTVAAPTTIERHARAAGLPRATAPSLLAVEARRTQLWVVAFVVMTALAAGTAVLSGSALALAEAGGTVSPAVRLGLVPLVLGLGVYVIEKECHLRRLTRALVAGKDEAAVVTPQASSRPDRDPLTGALDRDGFVERLERALASSRSGAPIAVMVLELDRLPQVSARYGQSVTDGLVQEVARRLQSATRTGDAVARVGAQELAVLAEGMGGAPETGELARRIVHAVRPPVTVGPHRLVPSFAVGAVLHRGGAHGGAEDVLRDAGLARRLARAKGPNRWELFDQLRPEA